jgi:tetratricopeptide (TPR) repeat protein
MIGGFVKKFIFKKSDNVPEENKEGLAIALRQKSQELTDGILNKIDSVKEELATMKEKYDNLLETNYNLGLKHIENGNLSEAIFRFRFIRKFWPEHYDSYYQLAYCLVLNRKSVEAKIVLEELIKKNPQHQAGQDLLQLIESDLSSETQDPLN